jgi:hypothetical protein
MPKITSDGKLIFIGHKSCTYKPLTDDDWAFIEDESNFPITPKLRLQLSRVVSQYVKSGPSSLETVTAKSVQGWFRIWKSRTSMFRRQLSREVREQRKIKDEPKPIRKSTQKQTQAILDKFFSVERYSKKTPTTDDIVYMLDGANKLTESMISQLTAEGSVRVTRQKFWLVWIALLICLFRSQNIPISWRHGGKKGIEKGFVEFVRQLQTFLPDECKPRNEFDSIRKGIIQALPLAHKKPIKKLTSVMRYWGQGRFDIYNEALGHGFRNPTMFGLARFLEKIEAQSNK